jgi:methionine synthase II (cobalamin-independent)
MAGTDEQEATMTTRSAQAETSGGPAGPGDRPTGVHLVGSIPLGDADGVFRGVAGVLGSHVRRIPDGETGRRSRWNSWTAPTYEATEGLELVDPPEGSYTPWKQARLVIDPEDLVLERIGFADAALSSYERFAALKADGTIPRHVRFQVCLPSPVAPMTVLIEPGSALAVEPAHLRQLRAEIDEILEGVPHDQLAIQWDVCQDVGIWEGFYEAYYDDPKEGTVERLRWCAEQIPPDVELGYHFCYGDFGHKHFMNPTDLAVVTQMANAVTQAVDRRIDWIHLPVPIDRDDEAYFAPLGDLELTSGTELYLGLVHHGDGVEGAQRRMSAARSATGDFGVATECGFGRRPAETIEPLLRLHADIAAPVA